MSQKQKPTEAELDILSVLWQNGPSTVRFVHEKLSASRQVGYTTTLKQMQIMHDRNMLSRRKMGKTHIYNALLSQDETQQDLLNKLVDTAFEGSAMKLVMQALGNGQTTQEELNEIRNFLDALEDDSTNK
ncbi:MAG: BlaI/MecI/CopY family transcriptional regulator [Bacteroidota bacterium]